MLSNMCTVPKAGLFFGGGDSLENHKRALAVPLVYLFMFILYVQIGK